MADSRRATETSNNQSSGLVDQSETVNERASSNPNQSDTATERINQSDTTTERINQSTNEEAAFREASNTGKQENTQAPYPSLLFDMHDEIHVLHVICLSGFEKKINDNHVCMHYLYMFNMRFFLIEGDCNLEEAATNSLPNPTFDGE